MTLFDGLLILLAVGLVIFELRHDAGRALLDAVGTLVSAHLSRALAPALTDALHWKPFPGTETSPLAQGLLFLGFWILFLGLSRLAHRYTRWSMDQWDPVFGVVFGLFMAITAGHITTAVVSSHEVMVHRKLPGYFAQSFLGPELRSFRSYHYVVNTLSVGKGRR